MADFGVPRLVRIVGRRILGAVPSLIGVIIVTFLLSHALPGDPAVLFAGPAADAHSVAQVRASLGLDRSLPVQFISYCLALAHGDLGQSLSSGQPVLTDLLQRLPASLELTFVALIFAIAVAVPLGILAATRPNSWVDHLCRGAVTIAAAFPTFFVALLLVYVFYFLLHVAPQPLGRLNDIYFTTPPTVTGFYLIDTIIAGDWAAFGGTLAQIILPAISLGLFALAPIARITRAAMLSSLGSDFVRTARACGLSRRKILITYALRNAMLPVVNVLGMVFSFVIGSNVLIEDVYGWPGVGAYAVKAVLQSDYAAVQGFILMMATLYILLNLLVDLASMAIDPRVRFEA
jgi:ABC-type dipeptide/oligopeptide/nickel transport system permease component